MAVTDTTTIRRTRAQKINALAGAYALKLAKDRGDPLYEKLVKFRKIYRALKRQLLAKYGQKGLMMARKAVTGGR